MGYKIDARKTVKHTYGKLSGGPLCACMACATERNMVRRSNVPTSTPKVPLDARGNPLVTGTRVAYNYSGDTAIGVIVGDEGGFFQIQRETHLKNGKTLSKVRKATSMLAIYEKDVPDTQDLDLGAILQEISDLRVEAHTHKELFSKIADAWDLSEVEIFLEEKYGHDWKEKLGHPAT